MDCKLQLFIRTEIYLNGPTREMFLAEGKDYLFKLGGEHDYQ